MKPRNQQVKANGIAAFYCAARGDPTPQIQWRKNGKKLSGTQSRYLVQDFPLGGALLRIDPVRQSRDDATYECLAENGVGDAVTAEAVLTVYEGKSLVNICFTRVLHCLCTQHFITKPVVHIRSPYNALTPSPVLPPLNFELSYIYI